MSGSLRILERLLWISGLVLVGLYALGRAHSALASQHDLATFAAARTLPGQADVAVDGRGASSEPDQSLWSEARVVGYEESLQQRFSLPSAVLRIPTIDLTVPVYRGTSELVLNRGVGLIEGTAAPGEYGNLGIAGHRDGFFRGLKDVTVGDIIEVQTVSDSWRYRISNLDIVEPSRVEVLAPTGHEAITLVTCYPFYFVGHAPKRYIVRGVLEDS